MGDTLLTVPDAVALSIPNSGLTKTTLQLVWNQVSWGSTEADAQAFSSYEVWRNGTMDQIPGADGSTYLLLATVPLITTTIYTDASSGLEGAVAWYYTIIVKDTFGQLSYSNEVEGGTLP